MTRAEARWTARYRVAFEHIALARPGWTRPLAEEWAAELAPQAWAAGQAREPTVVAAQDVIATEAEWATLY